MTKKLFEIAADIVQAQSSVCEMAPEEIESALARTFVTLQKMQKAEEEGIILELGKSPEEALADSKLPGSSDPRESIQEDKIVCLECGGEMRQLTAKHLAAHAMSPREYKKKYGFPLKQPLSARSLTKSRSKAAKKRGLPDSLVKYQEDRKARKAQAVGSDQGGQVTRSTRKKES